jgi:hypothetical protein
MNPFEFVIAILVIIFLFKLIDTMIKSKGMRRSEEEAAAVNKDLVQRLAELEDRVRVLERIVTDERYDLKRQFKDLEA